MSEVLRLARDRGFLALWEEGGEIYRLMESLERALLRPEQPYDAHRIGVLRGQLSGLWMVRDVVLKQAAKQRGPEDTEIEQMTELPRLMRVLKEGA